MSDSVWLGDCVAGAKDKIADRSVDLMICDPPFGIGEADFDRHYARSKSHVIPGYQESPDDYFAFTVDWMAEASRVLADAGTMYVFSGWSNLRDVLNALEVTGFETINHIIWKYNFGVNTTKKFVSAHYHVLYVKKKGAKSVLFNTHCRFGSEQREGGKSLLYQDLEDVWTINKEYHPGVEKNCNKLPDALIEKLILYSSNEGQKVCDFFQGNFTTAIVAKTLGRIPLGFEINEQAYRSGITRLEGVVAGSRLATLPAVVDQAPANRGAKITQETRSAIERDFEGMLATGCTKKAAIAALMERYGRGRFSIINILKEHVGS